MGILQFLQLCSILELGNELYRPRFMDSFVNVYFVNYKLKWNANNLID